MTQYLDSSAILKLVVTETETEALRAYLRDRRGERAATSALAIVEVSRALHPAGAYAVVRGRRELARFSLLTITKQVLETAANLSPGIRLRSLDAVHVATALQLEDLTSLVTYDQRMASAAGDLGLAVVAPA